MVVFGLDKKKLFKENKMKKILFFILILISLIVSACSSKPTPIPEATPTETVAITEEVNPIETEETASSGVNSVTTSEVITTEQTNIEPPSSIDSKDPIKVGWYGPLSGPAASVGVCGERAVKLAISQINANGGILGRQIELVEYDDEGTAENAVKLVTRLIEQDKVVGIVGSHLSAAVLATSRINETAKIIQIGTGTSNIWTNIGLKYTFRGSANSTFFNKTIYEAMEKMGATKIATINAETEYSQSATNMVVSFIEAGGKMKVVAQEQCTTGDTDYSGQITKMLAAEPDGVWVIAGGEDVGKIVRQLRMKGYEGFIYGIEPMADKQLKEIAGEYANDVIFSCLYFVPDTVEDAQTPIEQDFLADYEKEYNELPVSEVAYRAYDAMNILAQAIENANSTNGDDIRNAILTNKFEGIAGTFDFSDESGDGILAGNTFINNKGKTIMLSDYLAEK